MCRRFAKREYLLALENIRPALLRRALGIYLTGLEDRRVTSW